jgi:SNF2 family DNA or RNA helicase
MQSFVGRAELKNRSWEISVEPHVMIRLKQLFPSIKKENVGTVFLSDTPINARELLWFCERYPIDVRPRSYAAIQAATQWDRERRVQKILAGEYTAPTVKLALPVRDYQLIPAELVIQSGGLLLADDLGLGKTVSSFAAFVRKECLPTLVVTLTHLPLQWKRELARFAPQLRVHIATQGTPYDLTLGPYNRVTRTRPKVPMPDVLVMNYQKMSGWANFIIENRLARFLVFDEVQELRHHKTDKYTAAKRIRSSASWCEGLSATPIYNLGGELWSVMDIIQPGCLGAREEFVREWCHNGGGDEKPRVQDPRALGTYLRRTGAMLRRTRAEVRRELPPLQQVIHSIDVDQERLDEVAGDVAKLARIILDSAGDGFTKMKAAGELDWRLRQATGIAKAVHVAHFVRMLIESGEHVVLYGWHKEVYAIWRRLFRDEKLGDLNPAFFTGDESPKQKDEARARFVDRKAPDHTPLLIMSLRAGAGLDGLQGTSNVVVFGELDWSPGVHAQAEGRVHRDGQQNAVMAYYLVSDSGSDPVIADVLNLKSAQSEGIRNPEAALTQVAPVNLDHMKQLARKYLAMRGAA